MTPRSRKLLAVAAVAGVAAAASLSVWVSQEDSNPDLSGASTTHPFKEPSGLSGLVATFDSGDDFTIALDELELKVPEEAVSIDGVRFLTDEPIEVVGAGLIPPGKGQRSWAGPGWSLDVPHKSSMKIQPVPVEVRGPGGWILAVGGQLPKGVDRITSKGVEVTYSTPSTTGKVKIPRPIIFCANPKTRAAQCIPGAERDINDMLVNGAG